MEYRPHLDPDSTLIYWDTVIYLRMMKLVQHCNDAKNSYEDYRMIKVLASKIWYAADQCVVALKDIDGLTKRKTTD